MSTLTTHPRGTSRSALITPDLILQNAIGVAGDFNIGGGDITNVVNINGSPYPPAAGSGGLSATLTVSDQVDTGQQISPQTATDNVVWATQDWSSAAGTENLILAGTGNVANSGQVALGDGAITNADNAVAIGKDAAASLAGAVAIGRTADALGATSVAIGDTALASASGGTVVGNAAQATNLNGTAVGDNALASIGNNASAFGQAAQASNLSAVALGANTSASADSALAVGQGAAASATQASALGKGASATQANAVALGAFVTANVNTGFFVSSTTATIVAGTDVIFNGGQIGPLASTQRIKDDIQDLALDTSRIHQLRCVSFIPKMQGQTDRVCGLIAEEVQAVMPELVQMGKWVNVDANGEQVYVDDGKGSMVPDQEKVDTPITVKYRELNILLLAELQKLRTEFDAYVASHP